MDIDQKHTYSFKKTLLATAICSLALPAFSAYSAPNEGAIINNTGNTSQQVLDSITVNDGDHALTVLNGSNFTLTSPNRDSALVTSGLDAYAINIDENSIFNFNRGEITTGNSNITINTVNGSQSLIDFANITGNQEGSRIVNVSGTDSFTTLNNSTVNTATAGFGAYANDHATLNINNSLINMNASQTGIILGQESSLNALGLTLTSNSEAANVTGISINENSHAQISDSNLSLTSTGSNAVIGLSISESGVAQTSINLTNVNMTVTGSNSSSLIGLNNSAVNIDGGKFELFNNGTNNGVDTSAFDIDRTSNIHAQNVELNTTGDAYSAIDNDGTATFINSSVNTSGNNAYAIFSTGETTLSGMNVTTTGNNSDAIAAVDGGNISVNNTTLSTQGTSSHALSSNRDSVLTAQNIIADTYGADSAALGAYYNSQTTLTESTLTAHGQNSAAIQLGTAAAEATLASVTLNQSNLTSEQGSAILSNGGDSVVNLTTSMLNSGIGKLVIANTGIDNGVYLPSTVTVNADNSQLNGDIEAQRDEMGTSAINISLANNTLWAGNAVNGGDITIDSSSEWTLSSHSAIDNLNSNGTIRFAHNSDAYSTLTVNGNMTGDGAYHINTYLDDSNSPTDMIHVTGDITGTNMLYVTTTGGEGNQTLGNGIEVITVDGVNTQGQNAFTLGNSVSAGAFNYGLRKGDITTGEGENWYLSNCANYDCSMPLPDPTPAVDPAPSSDDRPWREEVPAYIAAPVLNMRYGFDSIGTYHQRTGGDVMHKDGAWGRIVGQHANNDAGRFSYDTDTWFAQLGMDLMWDKNENNTERNAGVIVTLGRQTTDAEDSVRGNNAALSVSTGSLNSDIYSVGGYYTVKAEDGGYIDAVGMASWYKNDYDSTHDASQDGYGIALSLEAGKPYTLRDNLKIEPQAQAIYQYLNLDDFNDDISAVSGTSTSNVQARGGARLFLDNPTWTPYLTLDAVTVIGNEPDVQIADQRTRAEFSDSWWQTGVGLAGKLSDNSTIYTDIRYQKGFDSDVEGYNGNLGIKVNF